MTTQGKKARKTEFHFRITHENYDFLYSQSGSGDKSVARVLNEVIDHFRKSGTTCCKPTKERILVN